MELTIEDLDEIAPWKKRDAFMLIFEKIHEQRKAENTITSVVSSYQLAELDWIRIFGGRAYKSSESFLRTYYYYFHQRVKSPTASRSPKG